MINIEDYDFEPISKFEVCSCNDCPEEIYNACFDGDSQIEINKFEEDVRKKFGKSKCVACVRFKITKKNENSNN